jgi:hypothetical protein
MLLMFQREKSQPENIAKQGLTELEFLRLADVHIRGRMQSDKVENAKLSQNDELPIPEAATRNRLSTVTALVVTISLDLVLAAWLCPFQSTIAAESGKAKKSNTKAVSRQRKEPHMDVPRKVYVPKEIKEIAPSPIEFLDKIKSSRDTRFSTDISENWITMSDVRKLALRLDSKKLCPHVMAWSSSFYDYFDSTEGFEAAQMIYAYIEGTEGLDAGQMTLITGRPNPISYPLDCDNREKMLSSVRSWLDKKHIPHR